MLYNYNRFIPPTASSPTSSHAQKPTSDSFPSTDFNEISPFDIISDVSWHIECVVLLSQLKADEYIDVDIELDELDMTSAESKATYNEIKAYVKERTGLTVSSLNIAQVKQKCGIIEREKYNKARNKDSRVPNCPKAKEDAIVDALKHFKMI